MRIIGYQLRISAQENARLWADETRRATYLPNLEAPSPLSADVAAWPENTDKQLASKIFEGVAGLGFYNVKRSYMATDIEGSGSTLICVSVSEEDAKRLEVKHDFKTTQTLLNDFILLGFDVCDDWLTSGLSNCADMEGKKDRALHVGKTNNHCLFDTFAEAARSANLLDEVFPEHAPFFPVAVFVAKNSQNLLS